MALQSDAREDQTKSRLLKTALLATLKVAFACQERPFSNYQKRIIKMENKLKTTKAKKGWLIPYLIGLDQLFYKRWEYWTRAILTDKIPDKSIPYIEFSMPMTYSEQLVNKNLKTCLDYASGRYSNVFEKLIDWILWGFNQGKHFPNINTETDDYWYRTFNLGLFYKEPADHLADMVSQYNGNHNGYFPTPANVVQMMTVMTMGDKPRHEHKKMSVCDPCSGSGIMLMYASNYSLYLYGMDISALLCKVATVNAFIYVPWLAYRPKHLTMFDKLEGIIEIELPTGIKLPECKRCNGNRTFLMELVTDHKVAVNNGLLTIEQPTITTDLIAKRLKPENITCAKCASKLNKEKTK